NERPPVLDAGAISLSLRGAPGISAVKLNNTQPEAIAGSIGFNKISDFLKAGNIRFITWEQTPTSGRAVIALDRSSAPVMIAMLSRDVADYLSAIMAPVATGELLTKQQYLTLVSSIYGQAAAREIETAQITASINFPGIITMAEGASFSGSTAHIKASLADFLVLEKPFVYEVRWTPFR
ncbi:MAG: hypothetical protein LBD20_01480, partial [Spirochaetaceae bacterium]|nr:hypothetical protein [Spirochaetaceae bacterium]